MSDTPHQPCPYVKCGSSDAFSYNSEGFGYCHSCGKSYPSKEEVFDWTKEEYPVKEKPKEREVTRVSFHGVRGLDEDVARLYGIQNQYDQDGELFRNALQWSDNVQYRNYHREPKYLWKERGKKVQDLFGPDFNLGSNKRLYLTEGGIDAASLFQALGKTFPVKGLPTSSINKAFIQRHHKEFDSYPELVYAGELDEAGRKCADLFYQAYPEKMYYVPLTKFKDANDFLVNDCLEDLQWAARKPQRYAPENFFTGDDEWIKALREENPYSTQLFGHSGLENKIRGMVKGCVTFFKAKRGQGKTEMFRYIQYGLLKNNKDTKIALVHMEEMLSTSLRCIATYELGVNVRTKLDAKDNGITEKKVEKAALKVKAGDRIIPFMMLPTDKPLDIVNYCRIAASVYGCEYMFIDNIQQLIYRDGALDATGQLTQVGTQLVELSKELDIGIVCISHVNDQGGTQYAAALENVAGVVIEVNRDVDNEDDVLRNTTEFKVTKNRPFAKLGKAGKVFYDMETTILEEVSYDV